MEFSKILSVLKEAKVFREEPNRQHSAFSFKKGVIQGFNVKAFSEWVQNHIKI